MKILEFLNLSDEEVKEYMKFIVPIIERSHVTRGFIRGKTLGIDDLFSGRQILKGRVKKMSKITFERIYRGGWQLSFGYTDFGAYYKTLTLYLTADGDIDDMIYYKRRISYGHEVDVRIVRLDHFNELLELLKENEDIRVS